MNTTQQVGKTKHQTAKQVRAFVRKVASVYMLDRPGKSGVERRSAERMNVTMPVQVTPLNDAFEPLGYQTMAVSRDLSSLGTGLVMSDPVAPNYVSLSFKPFYGESFEVICKVAYCKDFGYYHRVGCEFFMPPQTRFSNRPATN